MTFIEAVNSGKPFRRSKYLFFLVVSSDGSILQATDAGIYLPVIMTKEAVNAQDWILNE